MSLLYEHECLCRDAAPSPEALGPGQTPSVLPGLGPVLGGRGPRGTKTAPRGHRVPSRSPETGGRCAGSRVTSPPPHRWPQAPRGERCAARGRGCGERRPRTRAWDREGPGASWLRAAALQTRGVGAGLSSGSRPRAPCPGGHGPPRGEEGGRGAGPDVLGPTVAPGLGERPGAAGRPAQGARAAWAGAWPAGREGRARSAGGRRGSKDDAQNGAGAGGGEARAEPP